MVREKLKSALEDAVKNYNGGMSANDAVVKSASDHDLTIDQADRVVESFNTAKALNYYDKNASDRTGSFDLASKKDVTLALFGKEAATRTPKVKAAAPDVLSSAFYFDAPSRSLNRKHAFVEKKAGLLDILAKVATAKWAHGYSDNTLQAMISDSLSTIKAASADIDSAIGAIDSYLWTATEKIANAITRSPYGTSKDKADLFKVACPHELVVKEVSKFCPILKAASGGIYRNQHVVDTAPVDDLLKEAEDIMYAVSQRKEYRQKKAEFQAKEDKLKSALLSDPSMHKVASMSFVDKFIHAPRAEKKADTSSMSLDSMMSAVNNAESHKKLNEKIRDDARGALLADLLSTDPILVDADPRQVSSIYKSIVSTSPRISLNKEVVRSVLRSAVNSVAISPSDIKVLTDVDKGVQTAFGGLKGND